MARSLAVGVMNRERFQNKLLFGEINNKKRPCHGTKKDGRTL